jgi:hypothetical protein
MGDSDGTQLHAQPAHDSFVESVKNSLVLFSWDQE